MLKMTKVKEIQLLAYNQIPPKNPSKSLTNFVIAGQQNCFERLFFGILIGSVAFPSFMNSKFENRLLYSENLRAASDKSF